MTHHSICEVARADFLKGFPDWIETIEDIIPEGDKVWVRFTATGTHKGEWFGLVPTGARARKLKRGVCGKIRVTSPLSS